MNQQLQAVVRRRGDIEGEPERTGYKCDSDDLLSASVLLSFCVQSCNMRKVAACQAAEFQGSLVCDTSRKAASEVLRRLLYAVTER